jgi:tRNA A-37 threonylcarbamoyl transferase component Bud32
VPQGDGLEPKALPETGKAADEGSTADGRGDKAEQSPSIAGASTITAQHLVESDGPGAEGAGKERRVGGYRLLDQLGAGGMGQVWRAHDEVLRRDVALKVLPHARADSAQAQKRMLVEARAQAALSHPNVCTIYGAGDGPDGVWIAMEVLEGPNLAEATRGQRRTPQQILAWGAQIAAALETAHARGLIHRDLKPANVMLHRGQLKLLDFGLAKRIDASEVGSIDLVTSEGATVGTPKYMSPEQARGGELTAATDVFSLGIVLYELFAGRPPFDGRTALEVMASILKDQAQPLRVDGLDSSVTKLVETCLSADAASRPSAAEVRAKLEHYAKETAVAPSANPVTSGRKQRRLAVAVGATVACALVGVAAWHFTHDDHAPETAATKIMSTPAPRAVASGLDREVVVGVAGTGSVGTLGTTVAATKDEWYYALDGRLMEVRAGSAARVAGVGAVELVDCCVNGAPYFWSSDRRRIEMLGSAADDSALDDLKFEDTLSPDGAIVARWEPVPSGDYTLEAGHAPLRLITRSTGKPLAIVDILRLARPARWNPDGTRIAIESCVENRACSIQVLELSSRSTTDVAVVREVQHTGWDSTGMAWRDAQRFWYTVTHDGRTTIREWHVGDDASRAPRTVFQYPDGVRAKLAALTGTELIYYAIDVKVGAYLATRGSDGHWGLPELVQRDVVPIGWTSDARLVWMQRDEKRNADELFQGLPAGPGQLLHPEDDDTDLAGFTERAVGADQVLHWRKDGLYVLRADGSLRRLASHSNTSMVSCGNRRCVSAVVHDEHLFVYELDLERGIGAELGGWPLAPLPEPLRRGTFYYVVRPVVSPDDDKVAVAVGQDIRILSRTSKPTVVHVPYPIESFAFDGTSGRLIITSPNLVSEWEPSGSRRTVASGISFSHPSISPDGKRLVLYGNQTTAALHTMPIPE